MQQPGLALLHFPSQIVELDIICLDAAFSDILKSARFVHPLSFDVQRTRTWTVSPIGSVFLVLHFWDHDCGVACIVIRGLLPFIGRFVQNFDLLHSGPILASNMLLILLKNNVVTNESLR